MIHSIRLRHIARLGRLERLVERISKHLRHIVVETKSGDDSRFASDLSVSTDAHSVGGKTDYVLTSPITARGNAVNNKLFPVGQIDKEGFLGRNFLLGHRQSPIGKIYDVSSFNQKAAGVQPGPAPVKESAV